MTGESTGRAIVIRGDARNLPLPDQSVDLICTSPPYWQLRSYTDGGQHYDGQIGDEPTPGEYIDALIECTREWMRVLKPSGSIFVNLADKFAGGGQGGNVGGNLDGGPHLNRTTAAARKVPPGMRAKSLLGLPWRFALGCTDRLGLILRRDLIWEKANAMPESVTDRCRSSHEYLFHLTKEPVYFSAVDEIREPLRAPRRKAGASAFGARDVSLTRTGTGEYVGQNPLGSVPGSVWEIATQPLRVPEHLGVDHFATFPPALVRRIVLGWSPSGICSECGDGRRPVCDRKRMEWRESPTIAGRTGNRSYKPASGTMLAPAETRITGYICACPKPDSPTRPDVVLDPFGGTGTTALVASALGRRGVSIDRSADYCRIAQWRTTDPGERARALGLPKPPPQVPGQEAIFDHEEVTHA